VLALTPDVESALRWFHWTHTLTLVPMFGGRYERTAWPADGGVGDQDAWLTAALSHLRDVHNDILEERRPTTPKQS
jgi:hypothetical protein